MTRRLAVATGDPAGIGPEVTLLAAKTFATSATLLVFGDATRLQSRGRAMGLDGEVFARAAEVRDVLPGQVAYVHAATWSDACIEAHSATAEGGAAQLATLDAAANAVVARHAEALVTAPASKHAITLSGTSFMGQTEHLARLSMLRDDDVSMLFLGPKLRVGLVTTHLSVRDAAAAVTEGRVMRTARHLAAAVRALEPGNRPLKLAISGVNPHAGEAGMFGTEDRDVLAPAVAMLRNDATLATWHVSVDGPVPAESAMRRAADGGFDGVVAMLHDQATIACKLVDWGKSVNVTWGLPFLRTSVDHGVAYDAAAAGKGDPEGMEAALAMALRLLDGATARGGGGA